MGWRFEWIRRWPDVWEASFEAKWLHIEAGDAFGHVYHRPALVRAWAETRGRAVGAEPMVGLAYDDAGRCVLLPWVTVSYPGSFVRRRVLEPAGQSLFGYHDPLVNGHEADTIDWEAFWEAARSATAAVCDQALFRFVSSRYGRGPRSSPSGDASPVLQLAGLGSLDTLLARCSANHRGDVRRRLRRIEEKGPVELWVPEPREAAAALADFTERFLPAYRALAPDRQGACLFADPGMLDFACRVIREGLPAGWAHYAALRVDGVPVAWHLGLFHQDELYWWIPTYDQAWESLSPGKVLLARLLEWGAARHWRRVHFLTGGQPYKLAWNPELPALHGIRWHAPTVSGRILACYDAFHAGGAVTAAQS